MSIPHDNSLRIGSHCSIDSGLIGGNKKLVAGSSLAVHVKGGTYTAHSVGSSIFLVASDYS
jgi:hypothetical protein